MKSFIFGDLKKVHTLMVQIKTTTNKGDVFMVGSFFGGGGTKKIEIFGWNSTKNEDGFMNFIIWSE